MDAARLIVLCRQAAAENEAREAAAERANAHASGDCLTGCLHPDHAWDEVTPDLDWLMFGEVAGWEMHQALTREESGGSGFVML